ncbi:hypothetical protein K2173_010323 [Erythroxylum novogranatense]|uniref:CCT domain-containing protein n=1 Tax=Erythroxylum novogranatense TaxID=1862640 RepID=A0AAV8TF51_9ROSI|nr:hypothetical protein K2173_010323 [Erythroxylum novogranatense]
MSSHPFVFDGSFYQHSTPEMVSNDADILFPEPFSPFHDSAIDIFQHLSNNQDTQNPVLNSNSVDSFTANILSSSPPTHQLKNLTLYQITNMQPLANGSDFVDTSNLTNGYYDFPGLDALEVKTELGSDLSCNYRFFVPNSYSGSENVAKVMQRSYSSNSFDSKPSFVYQPHFDTLLESSSYENQGLSSPENSLLISDLRRVCSTGDLKNIKTAHPTQRSFSSPSATETSLIEEANFKVGRYSADERKERISKYRAKRNQRNFTKTIKYACRKTLADNRPRIRGRFARNDEAGEIPKAACFVRDEDEDELWHFDGLHEEEDGPFGGGGGGDFANGYDQTQLQYHSYGY